MVYVDRDGERHEIQGKVGDNVLYLAHRHGIAMEGQSLTPHNTTLSFSELHLLFYNIREGQIRYSELGSVHGAILVEHYLSDDTQFKFSRSHHRQWEIFYSIWSSSSDMWVCHGCIVQLQFLSFYGRVAYMYISSDRWVAYIIYHLLMGYIIN